MLQYSRTLESASADAPTGPAEAPTTVPADLNKYH